MGTHLWRKAAVMVFAVAVLTGQVAAITQVPELMEQVACWAMSLLWLAAVSLAMRFARPRAASAPEPRPEPLAAAVREDDRQPSSRMRAAWFMARAGSDTQLVADIAQVPHALAELIVADARRGSGERPR